MLAAWFCDGLLEALSPYFESLPSVPGLGCFVSMKLVRRFSGLYRSQTCSSRTTLWVDPVFLRGGTRDKVTKDLFAMVVAVSPCNDHGWHVFLLVVISLVQGTLLASPSFPHPKEKAGSCQKHVPDNIRRSFEMEPYVSIRQSRPHDDNIETQGHA